MIGDQSPTRSEEDLRSALRSLEQQAPSPESVLAGLNGAVRGPTGRFRRPRLSVRWLGVVVMPATVCVLALAVAVSLATAPAGKRARGLPNEATSLRHAVLLAFSRSGGDILYVRQRWFRWIALPAQGHRDYMAGRETRRWYAPWQPLPGQLGRTRELDLDGGKVYSDGMVTYTMPRRAARSEKLIWPWPWGVPAPVIDWGKDRTRPDARAVAVFYAERAWGTQTGHVMNVVDYLGVLRRQMAAGQWRIGRRAVVNGQRAVELAWRSQPAARAYLGTGPNVPGHQVLQLWVSARTHLPVRLVSFVAVAARQHGPAAGPATVTQVIVYDCRFLAPTTANLAQLRVQVPKGFRRIHMGP